MNDKTRGYIARVMKWGATGFACNSCTVSAYLRKRVWEILVTDVVCISWMVPENDINAVGTRNMMI